MEINLIMQIVVDSYLQIFRVL